MDELKTFFDALTALRCGECVGIRRKAWPSDKLWTQIGTVGEVFPQLNTADMSHEDWEIVVTPNDPLANFYGRIRDLAVLTEGITLAERVAVLDVIRAELTASFLSQMETLSA